MRPRLGTQLTCHSRFGGVLPCVMPCRVPVNAPGEACLGRCRPCRVSQFDVPGATVQGQTLSFGTAFSLGSRQQLSPAKDV